MKPWLWFLAGIGTMALALIALAALVMILPDPATCWTR